MTDSQMVFEIVTNFSTAFLQITSGVAIIAGGLTANKAYKASQEKEDTGMQ